MTFVSSFDDDANNEYSEIRDDVSLGSSIEYGRANEDQDFTNTSFIREKRQRFLDSLEKKSNATDNDYYTENLLNNNNNGYSTTQLKQISKKTKDIANNIPDITEIKNNKQNDYKLNNLPSKSILNNSKLKELEKENQKLSNHIKELINELNKSNKLREKLGDKVIKYKELFNNQQWEMESLKIKSQLYENIIKLIISKDFEKINLTNDIKEIDLINENSLNDINEESIKKTIIDSKNEILSKLNQTPIKKNDDSIVESTMKKFEKRKNILDQLKQLDKDEELKTLDSLIGNFSFSSPPSASSPSKGLNDQLIDLESTNKVGCEYCE